MTWLVIERKNGVLISRSSMHPVGTIVDVEGNLSKQIDQNERTEAYSRTVDSLAWKLELSKEYLSNALAPEQSAKKAAELLAGRKVEALSIKTSHIASVIQYMKADPVLADMHILVGRQHRILRTITIVAALGVSFVIWLATVIRFSAWKSKPTGNYKTLIAVHDEWSNRTRHILQQFNGSDPEMAIVVLGRLRCSARYLGAEIKQNLGRSELNFIQPVDWVSSIGSLPAVFAGLREGYCYLKNALHTVSFENMVGMGYRVCLGHSSANWWARRNSLRPQTIYYGHTGLADTSLLEVCQQNFGARTIHVVHGSTLGWVYAGISNLGLFQTGNDAELHQDLFGYQSVSHIKELKPAYNGGVCDWHFFSNYLHPTNPHYIADGARVECDVLKIVSGAFHRFDAKNSKHRKLVWHPHPEMRNTTSFEHSRAIQIAEELGFTIDETENGLEHVHDDGMVLTTPSTIAVDTLRAGRLPVLISPDEVSINANYHAFPALATNDDALLGWAIDLCDRTFCEAQFNLAWEKVQPGGQFNLDAVPLMNEERDN